MYPAVYLYKKTSDKGRELRYSLRSIKNLKEWNGVVFICGDAEEWFSERIIHIEPVAKSPDPYDDQHDKLRAIIGDKRVPDDFILMNDDFFVTKSSLLKPMYDGKLEPYSGKNEWDKSKSRTLDYLQDSSFSIFNYDIHVPIILNKQKLAPTLIHGLQYRSLYGNTHSIGGVQYKDCKTRTDRLPKTTFVSTRAYTPELDTLFPEESEFEL